MTEDGDNVTALRRSAGGSGAEGEGVATRLESLQVALAALAQRIDALNQPARRVAGAGDEADRAEVVAEMRAVLEAQERMNRLLADTFAHLDRAQSDLAERVGLVAEAVDVLVTRDPTDHLTALREQVLDVASGEVVAALWDELHRFRDEVTSGGGVGGHGRGGSSAGVVAALGDLRDRFDAGLVIESDRVEAHLVPEVMDELRREIRAAGTVPEATAEALRAELVALRRRIAVKADEQVLRPAQIDALAAALATRLAEGDDPAGRGGGSA